MADVITWPTELGTVAWPTGTATKPGDALAIWSSNGGYFVPRVLELCCPCGYAMDLDLGTITASYDDGVDTATENYTRVSFFDILDSVETWPQAGKYYAVAFNVDTSFSKSLSYTDADGFSGALNAPSVGCGLKVGVFFGKPSNSLGDGGAGIGLGLLTSQSSEYGTTDQQYHIFDWDTAGHQFLASGTSSYSSANNREPEYVADPLNLPGGWSDGSPEYWTVSVGGMAITDQRPFDQIDTGDYPTNATG